MLAKTAQTDKKSKVSGLTRILHSVIDITHTARVRMKMNKYLVKTARPSSGGTFRPEHSSAVFIKHIKRAGLLAGTLGATVVLVTGCSATGTGFGARLINPVPNNQKATNSEDDSWYQPPRSPGFDSDFGS